MSSHRRAGLSAIAAALVLAVTPAVAGDDLGNLPHRGAFTCDLVVDAQEAPPHELAATLEIDRMLMSGSAFAAGMKHKIIPFTYPAPDPAFADTLVIHAGGRYLFDTRGQARTYGDFVKNGFVFDGIPFRERPVFLADDCHDWEVVAASEFIDDYLHRSLRTERWSVPAQPLATVSSLRGAWPAVEAEAQRRGYAAAWLLYSRNEDLATLVTFDEGLDLITDRLLLPPLGALVQQPGWRKTFDRDQYTLTNWQPFVPGDQGVASAWPNFPLIPIEPRCGDNVCEPSRGETHGSCGGDCAPACGDAVCDAGEDEHGCPGDCQLY